MNNPTNTRDPGLDALRGLMLITMSTDHFLSVIGKHVEEVLGFVTAAEGFVFLSGYVSGLTFARTLAQKGRQAMVGRAVGRFRTIYFSHIFTFMVGFGCLTFFRKNVPWPDWAWGWDVSRYDHPYMTLFLGTTLLFQPYQLCILPMYCILILSVPPVILLLRQGRHWWVLSTSLGIWLLAQSWDIRDRWALFCSRFFHVDFGFFNIFAWQLLFISGIVLGQSRFLNGGNTTPIGRKTLAILMVSAVAFFLLRNNLLFFRNCPPIPDFLVEKFDLGPVRLPNFAILAVLFSRPFLWPAKGIWTRGLGYLGRHSLPVFSFHIVMLYLVQCFVIPHISANETSRKIIAAVGTGLLYLPAWICEILYQS